MYSTSERLSRTWVTVSDTEDVDVDVDDNICNEILDGVQNVVTVTCDYNNRNLPLRGRYVTIRRKDDAFERFLLNFCEVEVFSCRPGHWGYNLLDFAHGCSNFCNRCKNNPETCRVSDGYCFSGCEEGFWGNSCDKQCNCPGSDCDRFAGCPPGMSLHKCSFIVFKRYQSLK